MSEWLITGGNLSNTVGTSDSIGFTGPGGAFTTPVIVGDVEGQEGTFVRSWPGSTNGGALPNCQYVDSTQAVVTGGAKSISNVLASECTLRIRLTSTLMGTTNTFFDAYGTLITDSPADGDVIIYGFGVNDAQWSQLDYANGKRLSLVWQTVATTHDFFIGLSVRATGEGVHSDLNFRIITEYFS